MAYTLNADGQQGPDIDRCLTLFADVLKAIGVQELTIEDDHEFHLINTGRNIDDALVRRFCRQINQMHDSIVAAR